MRRVIPSFDFSKQLTNNSWMTRFTPSQILIAASLFFGFLFRIRLLSMNNSYWYDEAYLLLNIYSRSFQNLLGATDYLQVAPPAYLWCEKAVSLLFGQAEWSMRLPAFIAGILALLLLIPLANASLLGRLN
ncbi:MAG: hypothetical protein U0798_04225 [Gemmataceae bacterium]